MAKKGVLFIVDCLRTDVFPRWFIEEHKGVLYKWFLVFPSTPFSISSMLMGRHLLASSREPVTNALRIYYKRKPVGVSIPETLSWRGISTYLYTDEVLVRMGWWREVTLLIESVAELVERNSYFLIWHTFKTHAPYGTYPPNLFATYRERQEMERIYLDRVESAFVEIDSTIRLLKPDNWAVVGDHGEEFWLEEPYKDTYGKRIQGHGKNGEPLITKNTIFSPLFIKAEESREVEDFYVSYPFLGKTILEWFRP